MTTADPSSVRIDAIRAALDQLGIGNHDSIREVVLRPGRMTITRYRHDADGRFYLERGLARLLRWLRTEEREVATTTTVVRVKSAERSWP